MAETESIRGVGGGAGGRRVVAAGATGQIDFGGAKMMWHLVYTPTLHHRRRHHRRHIHNSPAAERRLRN